MQRLPGSILPQYKTKYGSGGGDNYGCTRDIGDKQGSQYRRQETETTDITHSYRIYAKEYENA